MMRISTKFNKCACVVLYIQVRAQRLPVVLLELHNLLQDKSLTSTARQILHGHRGSLYQALCDTINTTW